MSPSGPGAEGEVIFEIRKIGDIQRVAAIHVVTGIEVVIQAPISAALADVQALALRKLNRVLSGANENESAPPPNEGGKGKLI